MSKSVLHVLQVIHLSSNVHQADDASTTGKRKQQIKTNIKNTNNNKKQDLLVNFSEDVPQALRVLHPF